MSTDQQKTAHARGIVESIDGDRIVFHIPHTDYRIRLALIDSADGPASPAMPVGKRVRGTIEGRALRIHPAAGGGMFIEPVAGEPRIVSGVVVESNPDTRRILLDVGVPISLSTTEQQDFGVIREGELVNCYVESGTSFTPVGSS